MRIAKTTRRRQQYHKDVTAFTLIELMIVVAIIAILIALTSTAVQRTRSSALALTCSNNLKQIGLAMQQFYTTQGVFPSNGGWDGKQTILSNTGIAFTPATFDSVTKQSYKFGAGDPNLSPQQQTGSWAYALMPYMEQNAAFRSPEPWPSAVEMYICPARRLATPTTVVAADGMGNVFTSGGWAWARTDYAVNMKAFDNRPKCYSATRFTDGMSNTIFVGEKAYNADVQAASWYYDESFYLGGSAGTSRGAVGITPDAAQNPYYKDNWGSAHPDGVHFLFGDGTVRFLTFSMDSVGFAALLTPDGGEAVSLP